MNGKDFFFRSFCICFLFNLVSCTHLSHNPYVLTECITERIGKYSEWERYSNYCLNDWIEVQLQAPLSCAQAVQIALLNNPKIQGFYENIGIAEADLVQAGLISNPVLDGYARIPNRSGLMLNTEISLAFHFLDIFLIPLRRRVASAEFNEVQLQAAHEILELAFDVERVYFRLVAEILKNQKLKAIYELTEAQKELAQDQQSAQTIYSVIYENKMSQYLATKIELEESRIMIAMHFTELAALLGFGEPCFEVIPFLEESCMQTACLDELQEFALQRRLDFRAATWRVEKIAQKAHLKEWWTYTDVMLGVSSEREAEGFRETGPAFSFAIPIFDWGQAARARLFAEFNQNIDKLKALKIEILSKVNKNYAHVKIIEDIGRAYQEVVPVKQKIVANTQLLYNVMAYDPYKFIDHKIDQYRAEIGYLLTLRDYHLAWTHLKEALGGI